MVVFIAGAALAVLGVTLIVRSTRAPAPVEAAPSVPAASTRRPRERRPRRLAVGRPEAPGPSTAAPRPPRRPVPPPHRPRRAGPRPACYPPFTWDAQGKKHYKAECL